MGLFDNFPYTNFHELNLDWILKVLKDIETTIDQFVSLNIIKYADPIQWDIVRQYPKNTIVIDPLTGTAYISVDNVPHGVPLSNTDYWSVVFDLGRFITLASQNFANSYEGVLTTTATMPTSEGRWVVWNSILYEALNDIHVGDRYVENGNIKRTTVETFCDRIIAEIRQEILDRQAGDTALHNEIVAESVARENADVALQDNIDAEATAREDADDALQDNIDAEATAREDADDAIETKIGQLSNLNTSDKTSVVNAINSEITSRNNADVALSNKIGDLTNLPTTNKNNIVSAINEMYENGLEYFVTPQMFGAYGDDSHDDTVAVQNFFAALLEGKTGYVPEGTYKCTAPIVINYQNATVRQLNMFGAGCYRALFKSSISSGVAFLFTSGTLFDSFHTVISDVGFTADDAQVVLQIGKNDHSDAMGNYNFKNVFVANYNVNHRIDAIAARYNYLFDCVFENCVYICGADGIGKSLQLTLCRFCTFIGGSYSNSQIGIHFYGANQGCDTLTFIGSDFENLDYGVWIDQQNTTQYIKFITCYFDIWRPDLNPPTYGIAAVHSEGGGVGGINFDNCLFARGGIYGSGGLNLNYIYNCHFQGKYSYSNPAIPASGTSWTNNTGQDQMCYIFTLNNDENSNIYNIDFANDPFTGVDWSMQLGYGGVKATTAVIHSGATITPYYNGTAYWCLRPLNSY